jgi:uncharacterized protein YegL
MRRLPLYIVVETSTQMSDVIDFVNNSILKLLGALRQDPYCLETVYLSLLTFDQKTVIQYSLTELSFVEITPIEISKTNSVNISHLVSKLNELVDNEVVKTTDERRGDWKPHIVIFTSETVDLVISQFNNATVFSTVSIFNPISNSLLNINRNYIDCGLGCIKFFFLDILDRVLKYQHCYKTDPTLPPPPPEVSIVI